MYLAACAVPIIFSVLSQGQLHYSYSLSQTHILCNYMQSNCMILCIFEVAIKLQLIICLVKWQLEWACTYSLANHNKEIQIVVM